MESTIFVVCLMDFPFSHQDVLVYWLCATSLWVVECSCHDEETKWNSKEIAGRNLCKWCGWCTLWMEIVLQRKSYLGACSDRFKRVKRCFSISHFVCHGFSLLPSLPHINFLSAMLYCHGTLKRGLEMLILILYNSKNLSRFIFRSVDAICVYF